jgi:predicted AAA+ superfamily ATPase
MTNKKYFNRLLDEKIDLYLLTFGAVLLEGPKWCGKTTTASRHARSILKMQDPRQMKNNILIAESAPDLLLDGEKPRLIDEWQVAPNLWDCVRVAVDESGEVGQFLLTGSATPLVESTMHTGTGRIARIVMRPMSLFESLDSSGRISLGKLFKREPFNGCKSNLSLMNIADLICRGGWPQSIGKDINSAMLIMDQYVKSVYETDINTMDGSIKDPKRVQSFLRSYARNLQTLTKNTVLLEDMRSNDISLTEVTFYSYLNALRRLFIIEETHAWAPNIRSKTAIRTSNKKGFVDPSIATAILGQSPDSLIKDFEYFGFLFEAMCMRDLRIYANQIDGEIFHYRDDYGLECDAVVRLRNSAYALIEIKLGVKAEEIASINLLNLEKLLISKGHPAPEFKMILTGGEYAYLRSDGIFVVPIGCLRD